MARIYLNNERISIGSTGISIKASMWDNEKERLKGRSTEALSTNLQLDNIQSNLQGIFRRYELSEDLSLELIKSEFLGRKEEISSIRALFNKHFDDVTQQVGITISKATLQKYKICRKHFFNFIGEKYGRKDLKLTEVTAIVVHDFEIYLRTTIGHNKNTSIKTLKTLKTVILFGKSIGLLSHDPFHGMKFHYQTVDRGFLTDLELTSIANKNLSHIPRLELVRDIFLFSCFTGLAYIDVSNLTPDNIVSMDGNDWIMTRRQKTNIASNVLILDVPKQIISKYSHKTYREGKLFPMLSNQKVNSYLKEIADICGIKKNLTFHLARHTFATLCLSKGVPMESVSKMLGHTNIKTTQLYARITNKKIEKDMMELADKIGNFSLNNVPPLQQ